MKLFGYRYRLRGHFKQQEKIRNRFAETCIKTKQTEEIKAGQPGLGEVVTKAFKKEPELSEKKMDEFAKNAILTLSRISESERENLYG